MSHPPTTQPSLLVRLRQTRTPGDSLSACMLRWSTFTCGNDGLSVEPR